MPGLKLFHGGNFRTEIEAERKALTVRSIIHPKGANAPQAFCRIQGLRKKRQDRGMRGSYREAKSSVIVALKNGKQLEE